MELFFGILIECILIPALIFIVPAYVIFALRKIYPNKVWLAITLATTLGPYGQLYIFDGAVRYFFLIGGFYALSKQIIKFPHAYTAVMSGTIMYYRTLKIGIPKIFTFVPIRNEHEVCYTDSSSILQFVDSFIANHKSEYIIGSDEAFSLIRTATIRYLSNDNSQIKQAVESGLMTRKEAALFIIMRICYNAIGSGKYHVYRGVINSLGPGPVLVELYDATIDAMSTSGRITPTEADNHKRSLRLALEQVG